MSVGIVGVEAQGLSIAVQCFLEPALSLEDIPEAVVRLGMIGMAAQGLLQMGAGLVELPLGLQGHPQICGASALSGFRRNACW